MLSAIDRPHQPRKARGINIDLITGPPLHQNEDIQISEFEWPSSSVFEQAARIGNVIMAVSASLHSKRPTPIAKLHLGRRRTNLTFPTVAEYVIAQPDGYPINPPSVHSDGSVEYQLPQYISGTKAAFNHRRNIFEPLDHWDKNRSIEVPKLRQLLGRHEIGKLLFDKDAIQFAQKQQTQTSALGAKRAARRLTRPRDRRY